MSPDAEVGIIGAGPAGARAAELLATGGTRVVMLDPKTPWEKPCGGGLTPTAFDEIPELNELKPHARPIDNVRIEVAPDRGFSVPLERPLWILSRETLSAWQLQRAVRAGARHLPAKVRSLRRDMGRWRLETDRGAVRVGFLVGADGGASLVRRVAAPKLDIELAPTRVAYPREAGPTPDSIVLQFYSSLAGYLWDFPRPDHRSIGIGVPNGTWRRRRLDSEIDRYRDSSEPCSCPGLDRAGAVIGTAQRGHGDFSRIAGDDFALLGDAAGLADPLTGEGIQNALVSAGLFAGAWSAGDARQYPAAVRRGFEREFEVSRVVRRYVFETELAGQLINGALKSSLRYGLVSALVNGVNEHDARLRMLVRRWFSAARSARQMPETAARSVRRPVPCACQCERFQPRQPGIPCREAITAG